MIFNIASYNIDVCSNRQNLNDLVDNWSANIHNGGFKLQNNDFPEKSSFNFMTEGDYNNQEMITYEEVQQLAFEPERSIFPYRDFPWTLNDSPYLDDYKYSQAAIYNWGFDFVEMNIKMWFWVDRHDWNGINVPEWITNSCGWDAQIHYGESGPVKHDSIIDF